MTNDYIDILWHYMLDVSWYVLNLIFDIFKYQYTIVLQCKLLTNISTEGLYTRIFWKFNSAPGCICSLYLKRHISEFQKKLIKSFAFTYPQSK
jgi:hypothetical protein